MQSFLGDYNGSRKDSVFKLKRALESFNNQTNKNTELVLVSDNCELTKSVWENNYKENDRIKFYHLKDDSKKMYQQSEGGIYYRGYPRQIGIEISTGEIITYMDSDDFILENYLESLSFCWASYSQLDWIYNNTWYDNEVILENTPPYYYDFFEEHNSIEKIKIQGLDSYWIQSIVRKNRILMSPALFSHKKTCQVEWSDVIRKNSKDKSEDGNFIKELRNKYSKGGLVSLPAYVRCHLNNYWDI